MRDTPRQQLRPTVYLYRGGDDALMVVLENVPRRRKAARLMELIRQGMQAEALERAHRAGSIYGELPSASPTRPKLPVPLRIVRGADAKVYATVERAQNRAERLRVLATKGLRREAWLRQTDSPPSARRADNARRATEPPRLAPRLMASMVAALQKGEAL